jgi:hypothetical protein
MKNKKSNKNCCKVKDDSMKKGILYGLLPHTGCIAFIVFSVIGATAFASLFRPLLANSNIFYAMIILSFVFATFSAYLYLRRVKSLNAKGIKNNVKYLSTLYSVTIVVNLALFLFVFPMVSALGSGGDLVGNEEKITLAVNIPCPGHAPLITQELYSIKGVKKVSFSFPNIFTVYYEGVDMNEILSLEVFKSYPATIR